MLGIYHIEGTFSSIKWKKKISMRFFCSLCAINRYRVSEDKMFASSSPKIPARQRDCSQCKYREGSLWAITTRWGWDGLCCLCVVCQSEGILPQNHSADLHRQVRGVSQRNLWQANLNQVKGCGSQCSMATARGLRAGLTISIKIVHRAVAFSLGKKRRISFSFSRELDELED